MYYNTFRHLMIASLGSILSVNAQSPSDIPSFITQFESGSIQDRWELLRDVPFDDPAIADLVPIMINAYVDLAESLDDRRPRGLEPPLLRGLARTLSRLRDRDASVCVIEVCRVQPKRRLRLPDAVLAIHPHVFSLARDPDPQIRAGALELLARDGRMTWTRGAEQVLQALDDPDERCRRMGLVGVGRWYVQMGASRLPAGYDPLQPFLVAMDRLHARPDTYVPLLIDTLAPAELPESLRDENPYAAARHFAIWALGEFGSAACEAVVPLTQLMLAPSTGWQGHRRDCGTCAGHTAGDTRACRDALSQIATPADVLFLIESAKTHSIRCQSRRVGAVIRALGPPATPQLAHILRSGDLPARRCALLILESMGSDAQL